METEVESVMEYGGSLPVENVQQLSSHNSKDIPHRYVRPELEIEKVSFDESLQIPVIDMSKLDTGISRVYDQELLKLHLACKEWGFFQVISILDDILTNLSSLIVIQYCCLGEHIERGIYIYRV